jgi:hypothetical protein
MARIFLSHSSHDDFEAIALRNWLASAGWDDVFLDLDPDSGIAAGERWERALHEAASRCEAVLFVITARWLASGWCLKEYALARGLNKALFGIIADPSVTIAALPPELKGSWQVVALTGGQDVQLFRTRRPGGDEEKHVAFSNEGLRRLKRGLDKAGLDPRFFAWPPPDHPNRAPYRGLRALEQADSGVFFGREAPIVVTIDRMRGLREAAPARLLVILGASGSGKSSFLRAGLLPRLKRADADFVCLAPLRPERAALTGDSGLLGALQKAFPDRARARLREIILAGADSVRPLLKEMANPAVARAAADGGPRKPPTLVIAVDQAEELFRADGAEESAALLELLKELTIGDDPPVIALFAIRSDSFDRLEHASALEGLPQTTVPLLPLPRGLYKDVIEGPAQRAGQSGRKLVVEPLLTQRLLEDIEKGGSGDALPLLAFALEQLYTEFGASGALRLEHFNAIGGLEGAIAKAVERALARADADRRIPLERSARESLLRRGLVPWLAGIDPSTHSPRRNIALKSDIPPEARPLIDLLVEERLLVSDLSVIDARQVETVEPAHEALLRQWGLLRGWLADDLGLLTTLEGVRRSARDWDANARAEGWLAHQGGRLTEARALDVRPDLAAQLDARDRAYLEACSAREANAIAERERARASELARARAEAQSATAKARFARNLTIFASIAALALAGLGAWAYSQRNVALEQSALAETRSVEAEDQRKIAERRNAEAQAQRKSADDARALAQKEQNLAQAQWRNAFMRLAAADEMLDSEKSKAMRQCVDSTFRMSRKAAPNGARDFFIGRWHVEQGASSTDVEWLPDGTCAIKNLFEARNLFSGGALFRDAKDMACTWRYSELGDGRFEIDYEAPGLGAEYPKQLRFRILSPATIHNVDTNYDAVRIICPAQEIVSLRNELGELQTRAGAHPDDPGLGLSAAIAQGNLGEFLVQQGEANDAIVELNKAVMSLTSLAENQPPDSKPRGTLALALFSLGEAERQAGARSEARAAFSRGVELGAAFIAAAPNIYFAHYQEASALYELSLVSDPPEARDALLRAIQILDDMTQRGVKDADVGVARKFLQTELDKAG